MKPTDSAKQADDATEQAAKALNPLDKAGGSALPRNDSGWRSQSKEDVRPPQLVASSFEYVVFGVALTNPQLPFTGPRFSSVLSTGVLPGFLRFRVGYRTDRYPILVI
jgi:hypothetical protein